MKKGLGILLALLGAVWFGWFHSFLAYKWGELSLNQSRILGVFFFMAGIFGAVRSWMRHKK